tara:strand:+ start:2158 stop:2685 length:528 start_codon:yes stop_codon:yes gene_type:complete
MATKQKNKSKKEVKKKIAAKKEDKNIAVIKELRAELDILKDKNIKLLAEFDNFQRRTLIEKDKLKKYDGYNLVKDVLPVFDDIDRTLDHKDEIDSNSILEAITMINSKIGSILSKYKISKIDSLDKEFNPNYHEALLQQESDKEEGIIIEEYEKGYLYDDKIIRHAKVVVSKGKK